MKLGQHQIMPLSESIQIVTGFIYFISYIENDPAAVDVVQAIPSQDIDEPLVVLDPVDNP